MHIIFPTFIFEVELRNIKIKIEYVWSLGIIKFIGEIGSLLASDNITRKQIKPLAYTSIMEIIMFFDR